MKLFMHFYDLFLYDYSYSAQAEYLNCFLIFFLMICSINHINRIINIIYYCSPLVFYLTQFFKEQVTYNFHRDLLQRDKNVQILFY